MVGHEQYYPRRRRAERIPSAPRNTAWHRGPAPHSGGKGGSFFESRAGLLLESAEGPEQGGMATGNGISLPEELLASIRSAALRRYAGIGGAA
jgi:hypothetical protein